MDISASYLVQSHRPQNFGGAESECGLTNTRNFTQPPQKQTGSAHPKLTLSQGKEETTILPWRNMDTEQSELKKTLISDWGIPYLIHSDSRYFMIFPDHIRTLSQICILHHTSACSAALENHRASAISPAAHWSANCNTLMRNCWWILWMQAKRCLGWCLSPTLWQAWISVVFAWHFTTKNRLLFLAWKLISIVSNVANAANKSKQQRADLLGKQQKGLSCWFLCVKSLLAHDWCHQDACARFPPCLQEKMWLSYCNCNMRRTF